MRILALGVDSLGKEYFIAEFDDSYMENLEINTECMNLVTLRPERFEKIIIRNKSLSQK